MLLKLSPTNKDTREHKLKRHLHVETLQKLTLTPPIFLRKRNDTLVSERREERGEGGEEKAGRGRAAGVREIKDTEVSADDDDNAGTVRAHADQGGRHALALDVVGLRHGKMAAQRRSIALRHGANNEEQLRSNSDDDDDGGSLACSALLRNHSALVSVSGSVADTLVLPLLRRLSMPHFTKW